MRNRDRELEEMASVWSHEQSIDELKQKLLHTTFELESLRKDAKEETRRNDENLKQLLQLLKITYQERDESRDQLQRLLNKFMPSNPDSIVAESDSFSEKINHQSYSSSPIDPVSDTVSSPDLPNKNMADSRGIISSGTSNIDQAFAEIDDLVKGKDLPRKGQLLQAVMEAGPLLQTLFIAGPLPQWRNPPPLQSLQIPPVSITGFDSEIIKQKPVSNPNYVVQSSSSYIEMTGGSSQIYSSEMPNHGLPVSAGYGVYAYSNPDWEAIKVPVGP